MLFILIGTCGVFWNGLLGAAYLLSSRSHCSSRKQLLRVFTFIGLYEFTYSIFLLGQNLTAAVTVAAVCVLQFLTAKAVGPSDTATEHLLRTYLPNSEGPLAVGRVLAVLAIGTVFLLSFTALRDAPTWLKLLFTLPAPVTTYIAVSLLALGIGR